MVMRQYTLQLTATVAAASLPVLAQKAVKTVTAADLKVNACNADIGLAAARLTRLPSSRGSLELSMPSCSWRLLGFLKATGQAPSQWAEPASQAATCRHSVRLSAGTKKCATIVPCKVKSTMTIFDGLKYIESSVAHYVIQRGQSAQLLHLFVAVSAGLAIGGNA